MPPKGLYAMGRHHLYGGQRARPSFNSNDFKPAPEPERAVVTGTDADHTPDEVNQFERESDKKCKKRERREKKEKKEAKKNKPLIMETAPELKGAASQDVKASQDVVENKKDEQLKHAKKVEGGAVQQPLTLGVRKNKRKRESETRLETPTTVHDTTINGNFIVGEDVVDNKKASLDGLGTYTAQWSKTQEPLEKPSKKLKKPNRKSHVGLVHDHQPSANTVEGGKAATLEKPKEKRHKKRQSGTLQQEKDEALPPTTTTPRKTPIPPPQLSLLPSSSVAVLVPETPPSKSTTRANLPSKTPIPFPQLGSVRNRASQSKLSKKEQVTVLLSTPTSAGDVHTPTPTIPVAANGVPRPSVPNALTDVNLMEHTKPSTKGAKPKHARRAVSTVTSLPESSSTRSIIDAFARIGKPYVRSGAEVDPFVSSEGRAGKCGETHEEAPMNVFNEKFNELQKTVNFTEELGYMAVYVKWLVENESNQLPCLGNVTGCTAKKEEILRLSKEENLTVLSQLYTKGDEVEALKAATNRARLADELLMLSLKARVPVPIGRLEGTWTLYCPKYADYHFDRYGYGQRTLTVSSIAGFKHRNTYTARLNIPPRSMSYSILAFSTPPHASFRTSTVRTAAEGYTMDFVFLGNGYLQLRVDLNLLLKGKATGEVEGKKVHMVFIGVHEKAVRWEEERDELEEEAKKLFAKYDGDGDE
jgi:hypothetical protein